MTIPGVDTTLPVVRELPAPGSYLCGLTYDGEVFWHSDQEAGEIYALDPATGAVVRTLSCRRVRADLTVGGGALCQVGGRPKRILLIDPTNGEVLAEREVRPPSGRLCGVETSGVMMWMGLRGPSVVQLRDVETMTVRREFAVPGTPSGLTVAGDVVIYADFEAALLRAVDGRDGRLLGEALVDGRPVGLTWDGALVWYADFAGRRLAAVRLPDLLATEAFLGEGDGQRGADRPAPGSAV
ncbi:hypothetical protein Vqi01_35650 [Micromonospora qiuiae]|uniref:Glutaminyl-peptide cyclotransferase n=1 Tax=Micromonospora qiuiae TaxID=502268 RepID=A0ABQ4JE06_9ACTN|nr:PQQ-like beta-propeller repeat protein [Micromonospora qiuiae]GIJ28403.1 hypothetical protein Vqi01_35650 [Micromonospora qiuiae]